MKRLWARKNGMILRFWKIANGFFILDDIFIKNIQFFMLFPSITNNNKKSNTPVNSICKFFKMISREWLKSAKYQIKFVKCLNEINGGNDWMTKHFFSMQRKKKKIVQSSNNWSNNMLKGIYICFKIGLNIYIPFIIPGFQLNYSRYQ